MRLGRVAVAAPLCALAALLGAGLRLAVAPNGPPAPPPAPSAASAEEALRAQDLVAVGSFDLRAWREKRDERGLRDTGSAFDSNGDRMREIGIESSESIDRVLLASYAQAARGSDGRVAAALIAFGRFPRDPRLSLLASTRDGLAREAYLGGERVLELARARNGCSERGSLVLHWTPDRIVLADRRIAPRLLARLGPRTRWPSLTQSAPATFFVSERAGERPATLADLFPALEPALGAQARMPAEPGARAPELDADRLLAHAAALPAKFGREAVCAQEARDVAAARREALARAAPLAQAGPYTVVLRALEGGSGLLEPELELRSRALVRSRAHLQEVELLLSQIRLREGRVLARATSREGEWSRVLEGLQDAGEATAVARARLATGVPGASEVVALSGAVRVRVPREIEALALVPFAPGAAVETRLVDLRLVEVEGPRFRLHSARGGDRVVRVAALDAAGTALTVRPLRVEPGPGDWEAEFEVRGGTPARLEVEVALRLDRTDHAFRLELDPR